MSDFSVDTGLVKKQEGDFSSIMNDLGRYSSEVESIASKLSITGGGAGEIRNSLRVVSGNLDKEKGIAKSLKECLVNSMGAYIAAENLIKGTSIGTGNVSSVSEGGSGSTGGGQSGSGGGSFGEDEQDDVYAVAKGGQSYTTENGVTFSANGYAVGGTAGAGVNGLAFEAEAKGSILHGEAGVEGEYGKLAGEASVLGGGAGFMIGFSGLDHSIEDGEAGGTIGGISAEANAYAAQGEVEGRLGTEKNNLHVGADGTVCGAEAEAKAGLMYDETGYGIGAEAGAEAYVAKGEVKGGIEIAGIKITGSLGGKALSAGAHAGGKITVGSIGFDLGASLGIGADVGIELDWSDCVLFDLFKGDSGSHGGGGSHR